MWQQLKADGYVILRQVLDPALLRQANLALKAQFAGDVRGKTLHLDEDQFNDEKTRALCLQIREHADAVVRSVFAASADFIPLPQYQWVRTKVSSSTAEQTRPHCDFFYFYKKTSILEHEENARCSWCAAKLLPEARCCSACVEGSWHAYTCWIPFVDLHQANGDHMLEWIPASHKWKGWMHPEAMHMEMPMEMLEKKESKHAGWRTAKRFRVGDMVLFHWKLMHRARGRSGNGTTSLWRTSTDLRYLCVPNSSSSSSSNTGWSCELSECEQLIRQVAVQWPRWIKKPAIRQAHGVNIVFLFRLLADMGSEAYDMTETMLRQFAPHADPHCVLLDYLHRCGRNNIIVSSGSDPETLVGAEVKRWARCIVPAIKSQDAWMQQVANMVFAGMATHNSAEWKASVLAHLASLQKKRRGAWPVHITYFLTHVILMEMNWGLGAGRAGRMDLTLARNLLVEGKVTEQDFGEQKHYTNREIFWETTWALLLLFAHDPVRYALPDSAVKVYMQEYTRLKGQIRAKQWLLDDWNPNTREEVRDQHWTPDGVLHYYHSLLLACMILKHTPEAMDRWLEQQVPRLPCVHVITSYWL